MVALIVSISGVVGAVSGIVVSNRYNYALKNYGFSQGDIGKMMITFADTRSYLRAAIGYQDENLVNSCVEERILPAVHQRGKKYGFIFG